MYIDSHMKDGDCVITVFQPPESPVSKSDVTRPPSPKKPCKTLSIQLNTMITITITPKMEEDEKRSDFYVVFIMSLCTLGLKQLLISLLFQIILGVHVLRSYLKLICEYELHSLPNKIVDGAKDNGENYNKVRPALVRDRLRNPLSFTRVLVKENFSVKKSLTWINTGYPGSESDKKKFIRGTRH